MLPTLKPDQVCLFIRAKKYKPGQIVLAAVRDRDIVKRFHGDKLMGDNKQASTDYPLNDDVRIRGRLVWPQGGSREQIE